MSVIHQIMLMANIGIWALSVSNGTSLPASAASYFGNNLPSGGSAVYSLVGTWPSGVTINSSTGVISGTPAAGTYNNLSFALTLPNGQSVSTQKFSLTLAATATYLFKMLYAGTEGQTTSIVNSGTIGGSYTADTTEQRITLVNPRTIGGSSLSANCIFNSSKLVNLTSAAMLNSGNSSKGAIGGWYNTNTTDPATLGNYYFIAFWSLDTGNPSNFVTLSVGRPTGLATGHVNAIFQASAVGTGSSGGTNRSANITYDLGPGLWHHLELDWDGTNIYCFVNGVLITTLPTVFGATVGTTGNLILNQPSDWPFGDSTTTILLDEVFAASGAPVHTSNFTPAALP